MFSTKLTNIGTQFDLGGLNVNIHSVPAWFLYVIAKEMGTKPRFNIIEFHNNIHAKWKSIWLGAPIRMHLVFSDIFVKSIFV